MSTFITRLKIFFKQLYELIKKPEMRILPGQLAFFLLLSIIPLFAVIAAVTARFSLSIENLVQMIDSNLPHEIAEFIMEIIDEKNLSINILVFCISGFILASNGPHSMIITSNLLYHVEDKELFARRMKAILMTIILVLLFLFLLIVPAFGDKIIRFVLDFIPNNRISNGIQICYHILKYPTSLLIIYYFVKVLYTIAPDEKIRWKETIIGALTTTIGWIITTEIYSFYVNYFARYNVLYGSVANLLILFLWIYLLSYIFVLGMALNVSHYQEKIDKKKQ